MLSWFEIEGGGHHKEEKGATPYKVTNFDQMLAIAAPNNGKEFIKEVHLILKFGSE